MIKKEIDKIIEESLEISLNKYELRDEVFSKVIDNLNSPDKRSKFKAVKIHFLQTNFFKPIGSFMCILFIFSCMLLIISPNARVFASDTINAIKTIFIVNDDGGVVEVGQDIPLLDNGYSIPTYLSDSSISEKVGFKIVIPNTLSDGFSLSNKNIGILLGKDISYETNKSISSLCKLAILDDTEFRKLKEYVPSRNAGGTYSNTEGEIALIICNLTDKYYNAVEQLKKSKQNYKEINIGEFKGLWIEQKRPVFPNGDMTQKPLEVVNTYDTVWVANNLLYFISTGDHMDTNRLSLSPDMAERIAESFMSSQK